MRHGVVDMQRRTAIMGVLNVTPDSFSDGGRYADPQAAIARGVEMAAEGADIIDVGGESTRPGASVVSARDEAKRVIPVIRGLRAALAIPISIDTYKARVAEEALDEGADMVNDISALRFDAAMAPLVARFEVPVILMHMQGTPGTMQFAPSYRDVVAEVKDFLKARIEFAIRCGIETRSILVDPGIGFGKNLSHNLALLRSIPALRALQQPLLIGASRKTFIGKILNLGIADRLEGSLAVAVASVLAGADMVRAHDVRQTWRAVRVAEALRFSSGGAPAS